MRATLLFIAILFLEFFQELYKIHIGPTSVLAVPLTALLVMDLCELFGRREPR